MANQLKILFVSSEVAPYAKSGGLGDVAGSLPQAIKALYGNDVDIRIMTPGYADIHDKYIKNTEFMGNAGIRMAWRNQSASILKRDTQDQVPVYFIQNDYYFRRSGFYGYPDDNERFAFFSKAVIEALPIIDFIPDIIHCNDWQSGLVSLFLKDVYNGLCEFSKIKTLFTIHNLQYQGVFSGDTLQLLEFGEHYLSDEGIGFYGQVNYLKAGLISADALSTVSETYAGEIQTPSYGFNMDGLLQKRSYCLSGIVNGIDYYENNPETDQRIPYPFSVKDMSGKGKDKLALQAELGLKQADVPMIAIVSRLVDQKGLDLVSMAVTEIMSRGAQLVVLGTGDGRYEHQFREFASWYPQMLSANILFDGALAQRIYAASDFFLMPSLFEPCGLGQIIAMRYGTVPIVRKTGGLADTVMHFNKDTGEGNGFVFEDYVASGMMWAVNQALDVYYESADTMDIIRKNAMNSNYSWHQSAERYFALYSQMLES